MPNISLNDSIQTLEMDKPITTKLIKNKIMKIEDLWRLKRINLKEIGLNDSEIRHITIKLQLHSIDLNKKIYHKN